MAIDADAGGFEPGLDGEGPVLAQFQVGQGPVCRGRCGTHHGIAGAIGNGDDGRGGVDLRTPLEVLDCRDEPVLVERLGARANRDGTDNAGGLGCRRRLGLPVSRGRPVREDRCVQLQRKLSHCCDSALDLLGPGQREACHIRDFRLVDRRSGDLDRGATRIHVGIADIELLGVGGRPVLDTRQSGIILILGGLAQEGRRVGEPRVFQDRGRGAGADREHAAHREGGGADRARWQPGTARSVLDQAGCGGVRGDGAAGGDGNLAGAEAHDIGCRLIQRGNPRRGEIHGEHGGTGLGDFHAGGGRDQCVGRGGGCAAHLEQ